MKDVAATQGTGKRGQRCTIQRDEDGVFGSCVSFRESPIRRQDAHFALERLPMQTNEDGAGCEEEAWAEGAGVEEVVEWVCRVVEIVA